MAGNRSPKRQRRDGTPCGFIVSLPLHAFVDYTGFRIRIIQPIVSQMATAAKAMNSTREGP